MPSDALRSVQRDQLPLLEISGRHSRIVAAMQGAHICEWMPRDGRPVLFVSPRSLFQPGKPIRGGVPICFPWFGPKAGDAGAPPHGFARLLDWQVHVAEVAADGSARIVLGLISSTGTRETWPHDFSARLTVRANHRLSLALEIHNTGAEPMTFAAALHTYLAVSDVRRIAIRGLENGDYLDRAGGGSVRRREGSAPVTIAGEVDRIYLGTTATCIVDDPGWNRRIHVSKTASRSTVIWSPGIDRARALTDIGEDVWPQFVCVETCNVADDTVTLGSGATHTLSAEIWTEPGS